MTSWQRWVHHPERSKVRHLLFQVHLWLGALASMYVLLMSITGSVLVFRNNFAPRHSLAWLAKLHADLGWGPWGRLVNGVGGVGLTVLALTGAVLWWPGLAQWRRKLTLNRRATLPRIAWDLHGAVGFWCFPFVLEWGLSSVYFAFPRLFDNLLLLDPNDRVTDSALYWLSNLHFGRFGWIGEGVWGVMGAVPVVLASTGLFICCRRLIYKKPSNSKARFGVVPKMETTS